MPPTMNNKRRCVVFVIKETNFHHVDAGTSNSSCRAKHRGDDSVDGAHVNAYKNKKFDFSDPAGSATA